MTTADTSIVNIGLNFISHYGVRGMRWGQRKAPPASVAPTAESIVRRPKSAQTKIKAKGGENHPATEDALKAASAKQKMRKSGTVALTNKELQDLATRMNLEQQVHRLDANQPTTLGREAVRKVFKDPVRTVEATTKAAKTGSEIFGEIQRVKRGG